MSFPFIWLLLACYNSGYLSRERNSSMHCTQIDYSSSFIEYPLPHPDSGPYGIIAGPDGALWFTEQQANKIGRITTSGEVVEYVLPPEHTGALVMTVGPDEALWFTEWGSNKIGRITLAGEVREYTIPTPQAEPHGVTAGPDGALWIAEEANKIGQLIIASE